MVIENVDFRAFGHYVFGTLGNEANIIIKYYLIPCRLSTDPKYVTLNDSEWLAQPCVRVVRDDDRNNHSQLTNTGSAGNWLLNCYISSV